MARIKPLSARGALFGPSSKRNPGQLTAVREGLAALDRLEALKSIIVLPVVSAERILPVLISWTQNLGI